MSKEIIDLLEKIKRPQEDELCPDWWIKENILDFIDHALTLLKQQPTAGDFTEKFNRIIEEAKSMFVISQAMAKNSFDSTLQIPVEGETDNPNPLPDHEYPQQPTAGDFTKRLRSFVKLYEKEIPRRAEITFLEEACDIIDKAEAINKDLLEACKRMLGAMACDELNNGRVFDDDLRKEVKKQAKAAIAKASPNSIKRDGTHP